VTGPRDPQPRFADLRWPKPPSRARPSDGSQAGTVRVLVNIAARPTCTRATLAAADRSRGRQRPIEAVLLQQEEQVLELAYPLARDLAFPSIANRHPRFGRHPA